MKLEAEYKKLPEVAQIIDSLHATPEYQEDGLPIVRPTDILKGNLSLEGCKKVAPETFAAYTQKYVPARGGHHFKPLRQGGFIRDLHERRFFLCKQRRPFLPGAEHGDLGP